MTNAFSPTITNAYRATCYLNLFVKDHRLLLVHLYGKPLVKRHRNTSSGVVSSDLIEIGDFSFAKSESFISPVEILLSSMFLLFGCHMSAWKHRSRKCWSVCSCRIKGGKNEKLRKGWWEKHRRYSTHIAPFYYDVRGSFLLERTSAGWRSKGLINMKISTKKTWKKKRSRVEINFDEEKKKWFLNTFWARFRLPLWNIVKWFCRIVSNIFLLKIFCNISPISYLPKSIG